MQIALEETGWPAKSLGEALPALARKASLPAERAEALRPPAWLLDGEEDTLPRWLETAAASLGLEAVAVETTYGEVSSFLRTCGPALVRLECGGQTRFLAVIGARRHTARILTPELRVRRIRIEDLARAIRRPIQAALAPEIDRLLDEAGTHGRRRAAIAAAIASQRLGAIPLQGSWLLRVRPGDAVRRQVSEPRLGPQFAWFVAAHAADSLMAAGAWWMIGRAVLQGRLDYGLLLAWVLLMASRIPCRILATWMQGRIAVGGGALLKRRLLAGALRLRPEDIREQGVGQLLGRVIESEALESLALSGGLAAVSGVIELILAGVVLAWPAQSVLLALLLLAWVALTALLARRYIRRRTRWTEARLEITNDLIERMAGHATRLAQEPREEWHLSEKICRELGLGGLLDRMPAGLLQPVGETGWQLSHGERSRVFLARALLQGAELVILDESFGALDLETLDRAMQCVASRAQTLMVVAHP